MPRPLLFAQLCPSWSPHRERMGSGPPSGASLSFGVDESQVEERSIDPLRGFDWWVSSTCPLPSTCPLLGGCPRLPVGGCPRLALPHGGCPRLASRLASSLDLPPLDLPLADEFLTVADSVGLNGHVKINDELRCIQQSPTAQDSSSPQSPASRSTNAERRTDDRYGVLRFLGFVNPEVRPASLHEASSTGLRASRWSSRRDTRRPGA